MPRDRRPLLSPDRPSKADPGDVAPPRGWVARIEPRESEAVRTPPAVTAAEDLERRPGPVRSACLAAALAVALLASGHAALAQSSEGCAAISRAAAQGIAARIQADDQDIPEPESVTKITCLDGIFDGIGLDVLSETPQGLLQGAAKKLLQQVCSAARSYWNSVTGAAQCGLTLTGWNLGFGAGAGTFCPRLSWGGGGPALGSATLSPNANNGFYLNARPMTPDGYPVTRPWWQQ